MAHTKSHKANIHVVIDRTGSMELVKDDAIGGFNQFLADTKGTGQMWWVWLFDSEGIDLIVDGKPATKVEPLTEGTYVPRALTPLWDAVGQAIAKAKEAPEAPRNLLAVLTDGQENSSREWDSRKVRSQILELEKNGWQIIFIAVGMEAWASRKTFDTAGTAFIGTQAATGPATQAAYFASSATAIRYLAGGAAARTQTVIDAEGSPTNA